jgi:hypothetical protein
MSPLLAFIAAGGLLLSAAQPGSPGLAPSPAGAYPVVGTAQDRCYSETGEVIGCPAAGAFLSGQGAQRANGLCRPRGLRPHQPARRP